MKGSVSDLSSKLIQSGLNYEVTDDECTKTLASNGKDTAACLDEVSYFHIKNLTEDTTEPHLETEKNP